MKHSWILLLFAVVWSNCQKVGTVPSVAKPAALTLVNVIPNSAPVIPVINTGSATLANYFINANSIAYGYYYEYSPPGGDDTVYVVQQNSDTLNISPKNAGLMFYSIINLKAGGVYSLFLTGTDTSAPDYLFTNDSIPFYSLQDSVLGIRFVNLSAGSNPISINLEGSADGSEVASLSYKNITDFRRYANNSTTSDYLFVVRDAMTGDSITQFDFVASGSSNNGYGLTDPSNGNTLTLRNVTIAVYGSENSMSNCPLTTMLIDNY